MTEEEKAGGMEAVKEATAAADANHSSQQASTLRKAAKSLAAHPTPISCKDDALQVKFIGDKIASALGDWLAA